MKRICYGSLVLAAVLAVGCHRNNGATENATAGTSGRADTNVSNADRDFVRDVSHLNSAELDVSRLTIEKSSSPDVVKFAQMMVDDHTAAGSKLSSVAGPDGIEVPSDIDDSHRSLHDKLAGKTGLDCDQDYIDAM